MRYFSHTSFVAFLISPTPFECYFTIQTQAGEDPFTMTGVSQRT